MADETTTEAKDIPGNAADPGLERIAALEAEVVDIKNRLLRTLADMENLRRRTEREMADTRQYAVANFARDILNVGDNLRRAIAAVPEEMRSHPDPALAGLIEGVEVTERGLAQTLQKFGVKPIEAKGQKFDPTRHQAMFEIEDASVPSGTVADVVQAGYVIGDRVLRPAMVGITKGGPKPAANAGNDNAAGETEPQAADDPTG
jgi:molecular chaperone GrpE